MSSALRQHLSSELSRKVDKYGIVVWVDPRREYEQVADSLCPPQTRPFRWQGSWYRLRRELDELVRGAEPPRLIVYQPVETPDDQEDPLAEVRLAGTEYRCRLSTLIREALGGQLSPARVEELAQARSLVEAEAALAGGAGVGVRLPLALGTADPLQTVLRILADETDALLSEQDLWQEAREVLRRLLGARLDGQGDRLRSAAFRHLALAELYAAGQSIPPELAKEVAELSAERRRLCVDVMHEWRTNPRRHGSYRDMALRLEGELKLRGRLTWTEGFAKVDTLPVLEELAFGEATRRLGEGRAKEARALAHNRLTSMWVSGNVPEATKWLPLWRATEAVARLLGELEANPLSDAATADEILKWYVEQGWRVDGAHRGMEEALTQLPAFGELQEPAAKAREAYEEWLRCLLERFTERLVAETWQPTLAQQWDVHRVHLGATDGPAAYVLVDALRFELGKELADALKAAGAAQEIDLVPVVAIPPTITSVGMASLLPGAERGLRLALSEDGSLQVFLAGSAVKTVSDRVALLRNAHGEVVDLLLSNVLQQSESELREQIAGARLVLVRSQEADDMLEGDRTSTAWSYLNELKRLLVLAVGRLTAAGVGRFVITGDHGFLVLSRLPPSAVMDPPARRGELKRRCWAGKGGVTPPAAVRFPISHFGLAGDIDLVVPRGLSVFRAAGALRFLHGGLSPQELVVPVIVGHSKPLPARGKARVKVQAVGGRITTGVFSAALVLEPDLFTNELSLHLLARDEKGHEVARLITGRGYDERSATVRVDASQGEQIVTFQVTRTLPKGSRVTLEAYDANGQLMGKTEVRVAADVEVDHESE